MLTSVVEGFTFFLGGFLFNLGGGRGGTQAFVFFFALGCGDGRTKAMDERWGSLAASGDGSSMLGPLGVAGFGVAGDLEAGLGSLSAAGDLGADAFESVVL